MSTMLDILAWTAGLIVWTVVLVAILWQAFWNAEERRVDRARAWFGVAVLYLVGTIVLGLGTGCAPASRPSHATPDCATSTHAACHPAPSPR